MTQTIQPVSLVHTQGEDIDIPFSCYQAVKEAKINASDYLQALASLYDSTNKLYANLDKLDNIMESVIFNEKKEKEK